MTTDETSAAPVPAHATEYGDPGAGHVLDLYEDMRCSYCADLEHELGAAIVGLADQGAYRVRFRVANFLDRGDEAGASTSALAALGAAAQQGRASSWRCTRRCSGIGGRTAAPGSRIRTR